MSYTANEDLTPFDRNEKEELHALSLSLSLSMHRNPQQVQERKIGDAKSKLIKTRYEAQKVEEREKPCAVHTCIQIRASRSMFQKNGRCIEENTPTLA